MTTALRDLTEAALLIDCHRAILLEATTPARIVLGLPAEAAAQGHPIDAAMPALRELKRLLASGDAEGSADLTFWTPRGAITRTCSFRWLVEQERAEERHWVLLRMHTNSAAPAPRPTSAPATAPPVSARASRTIGNAPSASEPFPAGLVSRLAHELRSPAAAIFATADLLTSNALPPQDAARTRDYLVGMRESARHLLAVLDSMLLSRPTAGHVPLVDLAAATAEVIQALGPLARQTGARLELETASGPLLAGADATAVRRMLFNIATNAIRHGGPHVGIIARTGGGDTDAPWIEVEDDGPGIPDEIVARVLHKPFAVAATTTGTHGSGLGLPLTRELADRNHASLTITTSPGAGTRVRMTFSRPDPARAPASPALASSDG